MKREICLFILILSAILFNAQPQPQASFNFNNGSVSDEVSEITARLREVTFTRDRFGNERHAVYIFGRPGSYVNLGSSHALKPDTGSVSLWVLVDAEVHTGSGSRGNPILLTKNNNSDDFYESYALFYFVENKKIAAGISRDSLAQLNITGLEPFTLYEWHHLVLAWSDDTAWLYVDGNLEGKSSKGFRTAYHPADSVLIGITANKKNERYAQIIVDDIAFYDVILKPEEVRKLYEAPDPNRGRIILQWSATGAGILLTVILTALIVRRQVRRAIKKEKQHMELVMLNLESELRVNRALMNPHFVFNALNSLQNLILEQDYERANIYLVKFSHLIRKLLEYNLTNAITLETEIDLLRRYVEIENLRFSESIVLDLKVEPRLSLKDTKIPVMMLQPFVENAIWHGLLLKTGERLLQISFVGFDKRSIQCTIEDNGIGRQNKVVTKEDRQSHAINFIQQRLSLLNRLYGTDCVLEISDKTKGEGTIVKIILPRLEVMTEGQNNNFAG